MPSWDYIQEGKDLGVELVKGQFISPENLATAEEMAAASKRPLAEVLVQQGFIETEVLDAVFSLKYGVRPVNLSNFEIQPDAIALVPEKMARELRVLPIELDGDSLTVAIEDPRDFRRITSVAALTRKRIEPVFPLGMTLDEAIDRNYSLRSQIEQQAKYMGGLIRNGNGTAAEKDAVKASLQSPIVQAVDMMLSQAVRDRASDIHIEPRDDYVQVRNRIDGVLHEAVQLPLGVHSAVMTRIKVLANLNIAERRRPQDGQFSAEVNGRTIDFRVATIEGSSGEMAVLRVLDKSLLVMKLPELGMGPSSLQPFERLLAAPFGMILVSGPTGCGKTTTLYAALQQLDSKQRNIMTVEDPIEYSFGGINQIQVNRQAGITFPVGLRAIMRQDPDIILVGEIRDTETATTAVQAAITGHLVLSSIHANDAVSALIRLIDMGVEPYLVSSAVIGSLSQRLVRKVCTYCGQIVEAAPHEAVAYEAETGEARTGFSVGRGCNFCGRSGFLGRTGVFELLTASDGIRKMLVQGTPASELREEAIRTGMVPMRSDGMLKVKDGVSTPSEILRNVFTIT